ncbi:MAG TPA: ATP-binding protein [Pyrinomonadaceae bacterium]|nr:ATP-binding protein [Pyrinomonadaceae bacterium]
MSVAHHQLPTENPTLPVAELPKSEVDRRILIVDDEASIRTLFADYLSEKYTCTTASSADEALAYLAEDEYALVISDMMMPGRNGVELLREVTARYCDTVVIMVSGIDRTQRVRDALRVGAFDYLIKPCELDVLGISVERALERRTLSLTARKYKADLENQNIELATRKAELERLQAQLVHHEKMASLGQIAAGIAHELNNPAGFIFGNMDLLKQCTADFEKLLKAYDGMDFSAEKAAEIEAIKTEIHYDELLADLTSIVDDCRDGAERIRDVVQNLRLFSRLDEAELKKTDLHEGIDSTIRLLSRYFSSGHISLIKDYGELPPISCYAGQLNQVWMNLLENAAQAVGTEGVVKVTTRAEGDSVLVAISDTGCGIENEQQSKIFDPFFTTKPVGEGTGLGLSITYGIIERHGGSITVESAQDRGTTFMVKFPISSAALRSQYLT